ncbi:MAG: hypothetical protein IJD10_00285, partial [Clostridia bacterium]|nr:hypothetical protein [Clostridia bacterium]
MKKNLCILSIATLLCAVFVSCVPSQPKLSAESQDSDASVTTTVSSDTVTAAPGTEMLEIEQPHIEEKTKFMTDSYDEYLAYIQSCGVPTFSTYEQICALGSFVSMTDITGNSRPDGTWILF